jgi:TetR/AcrR family transcriptional regulator
MSERTPELSRDKERQILDAAQKRFAVYGLSKVTMDEIAADIGMGKASLYYYFPTKEDLFRSVIERKQNEFLLGLRETARLNLSATEKLKLYADQRLKYSSELANLNLFGLHSLMSAKPIFRELFEALAAEEEKFLCDVLRAGNQSGEFEIRSPDTTAAILLHLLQGLRLRALKIADMAGAPVSDSEELARDVKLMLELVLNGLLKSKTR